MPSLPENLEAETVQSILAQTVPVEMLAFLPKKVNKPTINDRITQVLNDGLTRFHLEEFDYLLRVDGDTILPSNFIEENLTLNADLCGKTGCAMLIKMSTFRRVMQGRFSTISDDTYLGLKFMMYGAVVKDWKVRAKHESKTNPIDDYIFRGKTLYRLGYEPIHVIHGCLLSLKCWTPKNFFTILVYFKCALNRMPKSDVADFVWRYQVKRLLRM